MNAIPNIMQDIKSSKKFLEYSRDHSIKCNSQYNAIPNTMQLSIQYSSPYNAIQFLIECNFQYIAITNPTQFPISNAM